MRVLLVDDEKLARDRLARMLGELGVEVVGQASNGLQAVELAAELAPEVALLDIRMPVMDGLEAARHLLELATPPAIVFCTAFQEHAIAAFDVHAIGYLLKPVRRADLEKALARAGRTTREQLSALRSSERSQRTHICARTRRGIELVPIDDVRCFVADQKYVTLQHRGGELLIDETLRDLEDEFGDRFVRIHRNALVNGALIEGLDRDHEGHHHLRMRDLAGRLEVSRRHVSGLRKYLQEL